MVPGFSGIPNFRQLRARVFSVLSPRRAGVPGGSMFNIQCIGNRVTIGVDVLGSNPGRNRLLQNWLAESARGRVFEIRCTSMSIGNAESYAR